MPALLQSSPSAESLRESHQCPGGWALTSPTQPRQRCHWNPLPSPHFSGCWVSLEPLHIHSTVPHWVPQQMLKFRLGHRGEQRGPAGTLWTWKEPGISLPTVSQDFPSGLPLLS